MTQASIEPSTSAAPSSPENRRGPRKRKVRPVAFTAVGNIAAPAHRTVTANVGRGGALLVTRRDHFPPAGSALTLMPFDIGNGRKDRAAIAIRGRVVYTRFSPRTELRFAGLKFEADLSDSEAHMIGLDGSPDAVSDTLRTLEQIEGLEEFEFVSEATPVIARTTASVESEMERLLAEMEGARDSFLRASGVFIASWGEGHLREVIAERHALARAKGAVGLRSLKSEWLALREEFPALVDAQLNRDSVWPHRRLRLPDSAAIAKDQWFYDVERDQPPRCIMIELRKLAGFVGRLLIRHGFEDIGQDGSWEPITHENALVSYRGPLVISDPMRDALCRGAALQSEIAHALEQAAAIGESESRSEALRLWDTL